MLEFNLQALFQSVYLYKKRTDPKPEPDPDPGGSKIFGSCGSGSPTLLEGLSELVSDSKEVSRSIAFLVLSTNRRQNTWKTISSHTESTVLFLEASKKLFICDIIPLMTTS